MNAMVLSECVYKVVDHGPEEAARIMSRVKTTFPPNLCTLRNVQWALPHVTHRWACLWRAWSAFLG